MARFDGGDGFDFLLEIIQLPPISSEPLMLGVARSRRSEASQAQGSEAAQRIAPGSPFVLNHLQHPQPMEF